MSKFRLVDIFTSATEESVKTNIIWNLIVYYGILVCAMSLALSLNPGWCGQSRTDATYCWMSSLRQVDSTAHFSAVGKDDTSLERQICWGLLSMFFILKNWRVAAMMWQAATAFVNEVFCHIHTSLTLFLWLQGYVTGTTFHLPDWTYTCTWVSSTPVMYDGKKKRFLC